MALQATRLKGRLTVPMVGGIVADNAGVAGVAGRGDTPRGDPPLAVVAPAGHAGRHDVDRDRQRDAPPAAIARAAARRRPDADYAAVAETFRALGDASRATILHALLAEELCVCDLATLVGITESAVSQHLRVLRSLRVVRPRKAGRTVYYSLEDACIRALLIIALTHLDDAAPSGAPARTR